MWPVSYLECGQQWDGCNPCKCIHDHNAIQYFGELTLQGNSSQDTCYLAGRLRFGSATTQHSEHRLCVLLDICWHQDQYRGFPVLSHHKATLSHLLLTADHFIPLLYLCPPLQHQVFQVEKQCLVVLSQVADDIIRVQFWLIFTARSPSKDVNTYLWTKEKERQG